MLFINVTFLFSYLKKKEHIVDRLLSQDYGNGLQNEMCGKIACLRPNTLDDIVIFFRLISKQRKIDSSLFFQKKESLSKIHS